MHAFTLSLLLLPTALAHRHRYGPGYGHQIHHHPLSGSAVSSGAPIPSTATNAPYGMGNTTSMFGSTGLVTAVSTSAIAPKSSDLGGIGGSSVVPTSSADMNGHAGSPGGSSVGAEDTSACDSDVVTVTENPIVTVTVTNEEGSTSEVVPSSSVALPVQSPSSSAFSAITGVTESATKPATSSITPVTEASTPESPSEAAATPEATVTGASTPESVPATTPEATSSSAVEATVASPSATPSSSLSTVTVIPIPATTPATSKVEDITTSPSSKPTTYKNKVSVTIVSSSSAPANTGGSTSSSGGCKRGIVATAGGPNQDQGNISLAFADQPNICWIANWYMAPPPCWPEAKEFVPQLYGISTSESDWNKTAKNAFKSGTKHFLSFGEPEVEKSRDHQSPEDAADKYMTLLNPWAKKGINVCSPAVLQPAEHLKWLKDFLAACETKGCTINMICIHWYDTTSAATPGFPEFKRTVETAIEYAKGKKVWVDNFQANGSPEDVKAFLDEAIPYLEGNEHVERYAYVPPLRTDASKYGGGARTDQFIDPDLSSNGTLTDLGSYYSNFKVGA